MRNTLVLLAVVGSIIACGPDDPAAARSVDAGSQDRADASQQQGVDAQNNIDCTPAERFCVAADEHVWTCTLSGHDAWASGSCADVGKHCGQTDAGVIGCI